MAILVQIPENPNCQAVDGQVFQCRAPARTVTHVRMEQDGRNDWWAITGIDATGIPCPATACSIEDSGEGACYLVMGGAWGLRLKEGVYLRVPILGRLYHRSLLSRFTDTLAMLVGSGCDLPTGVRLAFASTGSQTLLDEGELMAQALERGEDLTRAGVFCRHVPPLLFYAMRAGMQRNELQDSLYGLSEMYAQQAQTHQNRLQGMLMPIMIILVGGVVAVAVVAMFLPMVSLIQNVQKG